MSKQQPNSYTFSFKSPRPVNKIFETLLNPKKWWQGIYNEQIKGSSKKPGDEFTFSAGGGAHFSKQKLTELIPGKKITWLVTESNLSFLHDTAEWVHTEICFSLQPGENNTVITFTHKGLVPAIECYKGCTGAWTQYLENLATALG
jgi:hypothetical protein